MPFKTEWPELIRKHPDVARIRLLTMLTLTQGNVVHAAKKIGISHPTLFRYIKLLALEKDLNEIRGNVAHPGIY